MTRRMRRATSKPCASTSAGINAMTTENRILYTFATIANAVDRVRAFVKRERDFGVTIDTGL